MDANTGKLVHCDSCFCAVARAEGVFLKAEDHEHGYFEKLLDYQIMDTIQKRTDLGKEAVHTVAIRCNGCNAELGFKIVDAPPSSNFFKESRFLIQLFMVTYNVSKNFTLYDFHFGRTLKTLLEADKDDSDGVCQDAIGSDQDGNGANGQDGVADVEQNADEEDGNANAQNHDQVGGADVETNADEKDGNANALNQQDLGANEQNADQDRNSNEQVPNEQDAAANEQNTDHDEDANAKDLGANEKNADQDEGGNEQVRNEQDVDASEQNPDQDGGGNEQVPNEHDVDANEKNVDQDGADNEQKHDEDGGAPMKRRKM